MGFCAKCGASVEWRRHDNRMQCYDPDGTVHWDRCSKRRFARIKDGGTQYVEKRAIETAHGYRHPKYGRQDYMRISKHVTVGAKYVPTPPCCDAPPWEFCDCRKTA